MIDVNSSREFIGIGSLSKSQGRYDKVSYRNSCQSRRPFSIEDFQAGCRQRQDCGVAMHARALLPWRAPENHLILSIPVNGVDGYGPSGKGQAAKSGEERCSQAVIEEILGVGCFCLPEDSEPVLVFRKSISVCNNCKQAPCFHPGRRPLNIFTSWCASSGAQCVGPDERTPLFTDDIRAGLAPATARASTPFGAGAFLLGKRISCFGKRPVGFYSGRDSRRRASDPRQKISHSQADIEVIAALF